MIQLAMNLSITYSVVLVAIFVLLGVVGLVVEHSSATRKLERMIRRNRHPLG